MCDSQRAHVNEFNICREATLPTSTRFYGGLQSALSDSSLDMSKDINQALKPKRWTRSSEILKCVWRSALAGTIGPLCFILFMAAKRPNDVLAISYLPIILAITATVGAIIGFIIGLLHFVRGLKIGRLTGFLIGAALSTALSVVLVYLDRANDPLEFSWLNFFGRSVLLGLIVGALPGLFSVPKDL
jgi:hypothetical protein